MDPARLDPAATRDVLRDSDETHAEPHWRVDYVERMRRTLLERGGAAEGADSTAHHMASRDYPLSTRELGALMASLGLDTSVKRYDESEGPLGPYVACCTVRRLA